MLFRLKRFSVTRLRFMLEACASSNDAVQLYYIFTPSRSQSQRLNIDGDSRLSIRLPLDRNKLTRSCAGIFPTAISLAEPMETIIAIDRVLANSNGCGYRITCTTIPKSRSAQARSLVSTGKPNDNPSAKQARSPNDSPDRLVSGRNIPAP